MKRLQRDRCGYQGWRCTGITYISAPKKLCSDQTLYDQVSNSRSNDNNFYNLPVAFQGVINATQFIDLSTLSWTPTGCFEGYDPFTVQGFQNWWSKIGPNSSYSSVWGRNSRFGQLHTYGSSDSWETHSPGIITPRPQLSQFAPTPTIAVPTSALASADPSGTSFDYHTQSGCNGLVITARSTSIRSVTIDVTSGQVYLSVDDSGQPVATQVEAVTQVYTVDNNDSIQVYLVAQYNVVTNQWAATIIGVPGSRGNPGQLNLPAFARSYLLGTVKYSNRSVDVMQSQCSPIDMRDWVSQIGLPGGGSTALYVLASKGQSAQKLWVKVQDCT